VKSGQMYKNSYIGLQRKEPIKRYSIEVAFLQCLARLSERTDVGELELIEAKEILGASGFLVPNFENTEIAYYLFMFRQNGEKLYIHCFDEHLNIIMDHSLTLDPMTRMLERNRSG